MPVLAGNSPLLQSYTWVPHDDASEEPEPNDITPPTVRPYSRQCGVELQQSPLDSSSYNHEWDQMMSKIENAGKIVIDLDAITADLCAELDITLSQAKNSTEDPTCVDILTLETPQSDAMASMYDNVSILDLNHAGPMDRISTLGYTALAAMCSGTGTIMISNHHLNQMAFATTVMNGATLIVSGQQMQSADGILLEPLSLNEAKAHDDWHWWKEAMDSEMASMDKMNVFELANIPMDSKLISVQWVYKLKLDTQHQAMRYKARLVAQGAPVWPAYHSAQFYVDDLLIIGSINAWVQLVQQQLLTVFSITDQGSVSHIIGLNIHYNCDTHTLSINQSRYIEGIIMKFGMDQAWAASTPVTDMINTLKPCKGDNASTKEICHYMSIVGSLLWVTQGSRLDIAFAVGQCARFVANPSGEHLTAAKHVL
ncbi:hypothetical protein NDA10_007415 [Ustilago hordei]|nr:hypothetical protein NDA10_007415 [Ustilago hordei]UTT94238.1 hypothetical protein NDA17_006768 [Ustilago hordei]